MNLYRYYIELSPRSQWLDKHLKNKNKQAVFRRWVSMLINELHHLIEEKSQKRSAIAVYDKNSSLPDGSKIIIQNRIRIFAKKAGVLEHLCIHLQRNNIFRLLANKTPVLTVPEHVDSYEIFKRVRLAAIKDHAETAVKKNHEIKNRLGHQFIYLMPSSSKNGDKKLIRYYYERFTAEAKWTGKLDAYGFSRTRNQCAIPYF